MNRISKEGKLVLNIFRWCMTSYSLEISVSPPTITPPLIFTCFRCAWYVLYPYYWKKPMMMIPIVVDSSFNPNVPLLEFWGWVSPGLTFSSVVPFWVPSVLDITHKYLSEFGTILIVRKETRCRHIGYSYRLTARVLLYAPSHRQDSTYHGLCYTSRGTLVGTRNSSIGHRFEIQYTKIYKSVLLLFLLLLFLLLLRRLLLLLYLFSHPPPILFYFWTFSYDKEELQMVENPSLSWLVGCGGWDR